MIVGTLDLKTVALKHDHLWLKQAKDMTLFQITYKELSYINRTNPEQGLRMLIVLKRKIMTEIMTTFFPSVLLTLITFATTLFKPIYFEASLSVNLTTMLVMTTIFISKMEGLPPTSATKLIDYWLILCQLVPFAQVVLVTGIEYFREDDQEKHPGLEDDKSLTSNDEELHTPDPKVVWDVHQTKDFKAPLLLTIGKVYPHKDFVDILDLTQRPKLCRLWSWSPSSSTLQLQQTFTLISFFFSNFLYSNSNPNTLNNQV